MLHGKMPIHSADLSLALAHHRAGRNLAAIECYRKTLVEAPDHPRILGLLGQMEIMAGDVQTGIMHLERALALLPDHDETRFAFANGCVAAGRHEDAIGHYRLLLARAPEHLGAALNLISLLRLRNENAAVRAVAIEALAHHTDEPRLLAPLAACALADRAPASALPLLDRALAMRPDLAEAHFLRGTALNMLERSDEAVDAYECAIALRPDHAASYLNLGNALADLDRTEEAASRCREALAIDPRLVEAHVSLGYIYTRLGLLEEAMQSCLRALALSPGHVQAHWNLGIAALRAGDWRLGWKQYEWRKRPELYAAHFRIPRGQEWCGEDLQGRHLTICAEQGLGDAIQLARFLPLLAARGARLALSCDRRLIPLFALKRELGLDALLDRADPLPNADLWVDQMSLPGLFGVTPANVPGAEGYLAADAGRVQRFHTLLPQGRKVGLVWGGNPEHSNDRRRSMPAACLEEILTVSNISFVSLQVGRPLPETVRTRMFDAAPLLGDFADTAACVANLDLLISVDTSTAHVAGAIGHDVWVMLPFAPDWRWLDGRGETAWYRSMRLFRQQREGDWSGVARAVAEALRMRYAPPL